MIPHSTIARYAPILLWACFPGFLSASTTLTFATASATGVSGTSGGPILINNPNLALMLATGSPAAATPAYGSNVSTTSADNGAFIVSGAGTPNIALNWTSSGSPPGVNIIEGIGKATAGWGDNANNLANNGVGQLNSFDPGNSVSVTFTPATGKGVKLESLDFYKSNLTLTANQGRGFKITVTGNASSPTTYSADFAMTAAVESVSNFDFGGGIVGKPGEALKLTITRPAVTADETAIVKAKLGSGFAVYGTNAQHAIDNLRFSETDAAEYAADSDGDGLSDIYETYTTRTNPLSTDTDGDGLSDRVEVELTGTNPNMSNRGLVDYLLAHSSLPLAKRDSATGKITFRIGLDESLDLQSWSASPFGIGSTATPNGANLEVSIPSPFGDKHFYRFNAAQP